MSEVLLSTIIACSNLGDGDYKRVWRFDIFFNSDYEFIVLLTYRCYEVLLQDIFLSFFIICHFLHE